ncbi:MAG: hypothetical protein KDE27_32745 [Planctomycetes bacterium]|nr:hypothetical protein [Planctomycetota bacterium]
MSMILRRAVPAALCVLVGGGCAGTPPSAADLDRNEQAMLAPFLVDRSVGCNELLIEMTGNFNDYVGQPALDPNAHTMRLESGSDAGGSYIEKVWTNTMGRTEFAFGIAVGEPGEFGPKGMVFGPRTRFTIVNQLRIRTYQGRHAVTLKARAGGERVVVKDHDSGRTRDVREFVIEDGELKTP